MIFYFTGTGNSLYVAKQLDNNPISIPQIMKGDDFEFEDEVIGIVCPDYCSRPPKMVLEFLKKATLKASYIYVILTYGNDHCCIAEWTAKFAADNGIKVDYANTVLMVDNYLPVFDMDEQVKMDKDVESQLKKIKEDIKSQKRDIPVATEQGRKLEKRLAIMNKVMPGFNNGKQIQVTKNCIGCGICIKVCPIENFTIKNKKAVRSSKKCEFCLACANNCPQKAIKMKIVDKNKKARYRHPEISIQEIIESNNQTK